MFLKQLLLSVIILVGYSCFAQGNLPAQKALIDTFIVKNNIKPIILAKTADKPELFEFDGIEYPPYIQFTYNIYRDASNKIVKISECPYSDNGEWSICMSQYFNPQGNTFAFEKLATYFSIICSEGIAVESKCEYYSDNFQMVDKSYQFTDEYKKDLAKENCEPPVNTPYTVIKNLNEYMGKKNMKLAK